MEDLLILKMSPKNSLKYKYALNSSQLMDQLLKNKFKKLKKYSIQNIQPQNLFQCNNFIIWEASLMFKSKHQHISWITT